MKSVRSRKLALVVLHDMGVFFIDEYSGNVYPEDFIWHPWYVILSDLEKWLNDE